MTVRLLLVFIPILMVSSFPAFSSSAEAARTDSSKFEAQELRKAAVGKYKRYKSEYRLGAHVCALQMEEEYLASEIEPEGSSILGNALSLLEIRYRFGGSDYSGIDCSAFVKKVFSSLKLPPPHTAREQFMIGEDITPEC